MKLFSDGEDVKLKKINKKIRRRGNSVAVNLKFAVVS